MLPHEQGVCHILREVPLSVTVYLLRLIMVFAKLELRDNADVPYAQCDLLFFCSYCFLLETFQCVCRVRYCRSCKEHFF
jgi:hypothetical protein